MPDRIEQVKHVLRSHTRLPFFQKTCVGQISQLSCSDNRRARAWPIRTTPGPPISEMLWKWRTSNGLAKKALSAGACSPAWPVCWLTSGASTPAEWRSRTLCHRPPDVRRIVRVEEHAGRTDHSRHCTAPRRNDRSVARNRYRSGQAEALAERRHRDDHCIGIERRQNGVGHEAGKMNS